MGTTISVLSGPGAGRRIHLASGQSARFGRTEWSDYSFPQDASMSEVHFVLESARTGCLLRDMGSQTGTLVDGEPVEERQLHTGDEITAGETSFSVEVDGEAAPARPEKKAAASEEPPAEAPAAPPTIGEICESLELDAKVCELAGANPSPPAEFVDLLESENELMAALRLAGHLLQPREAVWWGSLCVRESVGELLTQQDLAALDAAEKWVQTHEESDRRQAHAAGKATRFKTAAGWIALAAFWSEGSLAPAGMAEVPPDPKLTGQAVTGAVLMAAVARSPLKARDNYLRYLAVFRGVMSGKVPVPKDPRE